MEKILELNKHKVVTLIGAGGKTSTMYHLANRYAGLGKKVLITTTTKIFFLPEDANFFVQATTFHQWFHRLMQLAQPGKYLVAGEEVCDGKVIGVKASWIDWLARSGIFDLILVEGDGSARKPLKAPAEYEPVIPSSTSLLLPVVGLQVINQPCNEEWVHRTERFLVLTERRENEPIRKEDIHRVYFHPQGYHLAQELKERQVMMVINQVDGDEEEEVALELADLFLESGIEHVLLTTYKSEPRWRVVL